MSALRTASHVSPPRDRPQSRRISPERVPDGFRTVTGPAAVQTLRPACSQRATQAGLASETVSSPVAGNAAGRQRVLVVDDDRAVRESLRRSLEFNGYDVAVAADGAEALAGLAPRARPPRPTSS